jgi:ribonucleoside-diphosphate reductase alpha chain
MLFWDRVNNWHMMSEVEGYEFTATNPCGELPLMDYGACLLGSINFSEFVTEPFSEFAHIDVDKLSECIHNSVRALNDVLDENIELHPLQQQRDYARDYRPIGLGHMGFADMLLKMGLQYNDERAFELAEELAHFMLNEAVHASILLAKEKGAFPKCDKDAILASEFVKQNIHPDLQKMIKTYGIYNAQLLAIAPTGSISTMWGVSGGIEPHFNIKFTRKVESVGTEDEYYEVFVPIAEEYLKAFPDKTEADIKIATNIPYQDRIRMQSIWQKYVDNAISSTCNLPNNATIEDIENLYIDAWKSGLKGVTVFRDGCERIGILTTKNNENNDNKCPECGGVLVHMNGCKTCEDCGYSPCSI